MPIRDGLCITQIRRQSSCEEDAAITKEQNVGPSPEPDRIDLLTEPTKCSLVDGSEFDMELALATVYPN